MVNDIRRKKLESLIMQRVATLLSQEMSDPRAAFLTVTNVILDREIKYCTIRYSVLGDQKERKLTDHLLRHARGHVRSEIAKVMTIRNIPEVTFEYDDTAEKTRKLERLIDEVSAETKKLEEKLADDDPAEEKEKPEE